ncbi:hypothetical protein [Flavobacterium johnsoniae]|uniref:Uncharacterized protein n=1 Tax=Flavobacterium johnsoniae TaxID=986 RepID=A0A1J7CQ35_FLAJO|nr:hypothetical protein [Flavobacterium johnsoniae]OIV41762.1 hypothetical protein BKM63_14710 [Flavobacterium johnsoniae]
MLGIISLILILLPIIFQFIYGTKAIYKTTSLKFVNVSLISFAAQILLSIVYYYISYYNFSKYFEEHPNATRCGTGLAASIFGLFFLIAVLIGVILVQYIIMIWKKYRMSLKADN